MAKIKLRIIKPNKIKVEGEYDHIIIPGVEGDFGVSTGHTPFITKIRPDILTLYQNKNTEQYSIHDGFVTVENDIVTILTERIESKEEIDIARAKKAKERAERRLKAKEEDVDFRRAEFALKRSLARIELANV